MSTTQIIDPATEEVVGTVELTSLEQTDAAIERARRAFETRFAEHLDPLGKTLGKFGRIEFFR